MLNEDEIKKKLAETMNLLDETKASLYDARNPKNSNSRYQFEHSVSQYREQLMELSGIRDALSWVLGLREELFRKHD